MAAEPSVDDAAANAAMREQWNQMAKGWSDSGAMIRRWLEQATAAMLSMAGVKPGSHVLDVAAGAGDQTLDIAQRVGHRGFVLATDLSPDILQFAKRQTAAAGYQNVGILTSDGESLQIEETRFDAVVCRLGLMLFHDPLQGLREMKRVLKPDGGVCTMVFSAPEKNPCSVHPIPWRFRAETRPCNIALCVSNLKHLLIICSRNADARFRVSFQVHRNWRG